MAAIGAFAVLLILWIVSWVSGAGSTSTLTEFMRQLSMLDRFENFTKGLIDTRDILFFASLIGFCLFLSVRGLAAVKSK